ncbi:hypothetical protein [Alphaproteobacteria bacterium endosymbiont of Tiliacea citrago]|uniref:hypothetical protein n=1 Tax=Alphaproteobacteria bacterium endosymbiont of Tiliacea citrago TaxID=3077944 RepID=UPI00313A91C3
MILFISKKNYIICLFFLFSIKAPNYYRGVVLEINRVTNDEPILGIVETGYQTRGLDAQTTEDSPFYQEIVIPEINSHLSKNI